MRVTAAASLRFVAMAIVIGGCAGPAPSPSDASTPTPSAAPAMADFGIPEKIGSWSLAGTAEPIDGGGPTAAIVAAAGGDPATARDLNVQVSAGTDALAFDALRAPGVTLDAFTRAAELRIAALGTTERSSRTVAGWTVIEFATPADFNGPPHVIDFTSHGDLIYTFGNWTPEQLGVVLAGLP